MPPYQGGGDMIESVTFEKTTYAPLPNKFEAGTPDIAGVVGLGAAVDYVASLNWSFVDHEHELLAYASEQLGQVPGLRIIGTAREKGSVISMVVEKPAISALDLGTKLDREGIAVRTGHHCCMPVMAQMGVAATTRASFAMYNTKADVDALVAALRKIVKEAQGSVPTSAPAAEVVYPKPFAPSPQAAADKLAGVFEMLGDDLEGTRYIENDLAKKLPNTFDLLKKVTPRVPGCMAQVYLVARRAPNVSDVMEFVADADASTVRGLIVLMQRLFSGQRAADVLAFDVEAFFRRIGLERLITAKRRIGLEGMIRIIRANAEAIAKSAQ
jgi:cysteine desulfurase/selenocysteine lyase